MRNSEDAPNSRDLVLAYVKLHNAGVTTGDFDAVASLFHRDAVLRFLQAPYGPFKGIDSISKAFKENPPSDSLVVLGLRETVDRIEAVYAWNRSPREAAGVISILGKNGLIRELTIQSPTVGLNQHDVPA